MYSNTSHKYIGKPLKTIIIMMQNIGFTTSPDSTTITQENIGANIDKISHELPTIFL